VSEQQDGAHGPSGLQQNTGSNARAPRLQLGKTRTAAARRRNLNINLSLADAEGGPEQKKGGVIEGDGVLKLEDPEVVSPR